MENRIYTRNFHKKIMLLSLTITLISYVPNHRDSQINFTLQDVEFHQCTQTYLNSD